MPRRTRKPYAGILLEPMTPPPSRPCTSLELIDAQGRYVIEVSMRRQALLRHYGLEENASDWSLMMALAEDWVPGFRYASKGQKRIPFNGASTRDVEILAAVGKAMATGKSDRATMIHLAKQINKRGERVTAETLRQRLSKLRRGGAEALGVIRLMAELQKLK
jgi:hypothetical protein